MNGTAQTALAVLLVASLLTNGWLLSDRYRRWQWRKKKAAGRPAQGQNGRRTK